MADESIVIEIKDGIDNSIASKLRGIATEARGAQTILNGLQKAVNNLKTSGASSISAQAASASVALNKLAISNANLATALQRAELASARLATETARTAAAQASAAAAADRLAASQARAQARTQAQALANANAATAAAKLGPALDKNAAATTKAGISTKQYAAAMRGVPAQITDIIVSLQGGQRPLTVLLQQGGQLKDMFGGIGPAARALSTGLIAMINPLTLAAAAMAALVLAAIKVESSMRTVNGLVAQFAATGRGSMDGSAISELRKELALLPGVSKTAATEVIQEFANIRDIGGTNLKAAAGTVADLGAALGVSAPEAAKKLAEALYDPLKGAQDLDKALGFLTVANFKTLASMDKAGKTAEAQAFLISKLREQYGGLAEKSLTPLERATNNLGNAWNKFIGELTNSGAIKNVLDGVTGLVNGITWLITKLDQLANTKPPAWITDLKNNPATSWLWSMGNQGAGKASGGASGSWDAPKGSQYGQTTRDKTDAAGITGSKDKSGENRAAALAKINAQLSNELKLMGMLGPEREKQEMFDRIEEGLLGRKIKLSQSETATIKEKIAAIVENRAVQEQTNRIYEEAIEPLRTYNSITEATADLLARGAISEKEANKQNLIAFETYANIVDPLRAYNTELDQSLTLSKMTSDQHEIESSLVSLQNDLLRQGITLRGDEIQVLRERLEMNQGAVKAQQAYNRIYEETTGAVRQIGIETTALTRAQQEGLISADQYQLRLVALGVAASQIKLSSGNGDIADVGIAALGRLVQAYEGVLPGLSKSFGDFFTTLEDGFANSIGRAVVYSENLGDALRNVAQDALSSLIGALVKLGIQYVVNAALGNTLAATSTATGAALASASAAAWAPAAALASLASFGANAAPAMAGIASTVGLASTLASVGKLAGFETGGYTGNGGTSQVAGVVHGREFVMDAAATNRIGVGNLEALQSGAMSLNANSSTVGKSSSSNGQEVNISIENTGTPQTYERVPTMDPNQIRMIARDVVQKETDTAVARAVANPNSYTRKSMATNTNVTRK